jgi:hypothetical protein
MLNNYASDASGNGRIAPFLVSSSHATEELLGRTQIVHRTFTLLGRCSAFIACCVLVLFLVMFSSASLSAQTAGVISGHVADTTGAVIPNANVTLTNVGTSAERSTVTTGAGDYTFPDVPPAIYKVQVTHTGFKTETSEALELQVQQSLRQDFTMQVGAVTATVTVEATGALLQAENATIGTVIENAAVNELPLNGRNYLSLVALSSNANTLSPAAGQAGSRLGGDRGSQSISVGGQRIMWNYYTLDGLNNTDPDFVTYVGLPSLDGIQEFKVQTGVYPAEFGHEASQVNVLSKSGTNTYHGSMYDFIRNNTADANPYWFPYNAAPAKVYPFKWNDYGFELDGAIRIPKLYDGRDKFFFMVDDEWRKIRQIGQGSATVPSPAIAGGNFTGFTTAAGTPVTIYDPATGDVNGFGKTPFPNNTIPPGRIASQSTALEKYLGTSTQPFYSNGKQVANYAYGTSGPQDRQGLTVRGDYIQSQKSQYAFRYSSGNETILSTGFLGAGSKIFTQYYQYMGSNTWTFTPHIVNEARFGYSHFFNSLGLLSAYTNDVVDAIGIPNLKGGLPSTWGIPDVSFSTGPAGTTPAIWQEIGDIGGDGPYVVTDPTWEIVDNLSWVKGRHSLRFGFEYNRQTFNQLGNQFSRGQFFTKPLATALQSGTVGSATLSGGDALADFLLGDLYQSVVAVAVADANYVRNVQAYYGDDTYKLRPNLTISAGLRYELTPPWNDTFGNNFTVDLPVMPKITDTASTYPQSQWPFYVRQGSCTPANVYQGLAINWTASSLGLGSPPVCSNGTLPNGPLLDTHYLNFAPRVALSYSPKPTLVVRAGYGIFYSQDIGNAYFDMARNIAGRVTYTNTDSTTGIYGNSNLTWANAAPGGSGGTTVNLPASTTAFVDALEHKTTYSEQYLLNVQKQVGQDWSFELGYQGAESKHLYGFINANVANPYGYTNGGTATSVASRTPFANMGGVQFVQDWGSGNYNAFSVKATRRFSKGLSVIASYTWGKSLDDTSGIRSQGNDELFPQNNRCIPCEYGPSAFNVKNRIVASVLYALPIGPGELIPVNNKGLNAAIGGWQIGGIFTHQTGQVGTVILGYDNSSIAAAGGNFDRPIPTGTSPYFSGSSRSLNTWLNKAAYTPAAAGYFGTLSRGTIVGPGFTNLDASLHKVFNMPYNEKHQLAIRFEAFNALNHPNWSNPTLTYSSATFGRISGTNGPGFNAGMRQLQLAAKYQF